ncbi:MAG: hypothetical protein JKY51_06215, partial [Opitutaceae bacterium]|nr:hypothetical protein [Opitutaceae bacterium]
MNQQKNIQDSLLKLEEWSSAEDWKAYDTFDGLSSPFSGILTLGGIPFLKQCLQQGVRRFPANIRPLLMIKKAHSSKGMGFFAQGYLRLYQMTNDEAYLQKMHHCLEWLLENRCPEYKGNAWGNHFDYQSRGGQIPPGTPTVVWTSLIAHAFLDAYEVIGEEKYLEAAKQSADFIINELGWIETGKDLCLSYTPKEIEKKKDGTFNGIHNSNVLGAGLLARVNTHQPNPRYLEIAKEAVKFTVRDQLENGAWWYGQHKRNHWVDSFHTAYNLESIDWYTRCSGDSDFKESLQRGYDFWINTFFGEDGTPHYYDHKVRPLDIQCSSQAIQTLVNLRHLHKDSLHTS